jgi:hypothetical protein
MATVAVVGVAGAVALVGVAAAVAALTAMGLGAAVRSVATVAVGIAMAVAVGLVASRAVRARRVAVASRAVVAIAKKSAANESVRGNLKSRPTPPLSAEKLLLFILPPRISDPIIGDLTERFASVQERYGDRFARAWYWRHAVGAAIRFVGPRLAGATSVGAVLSVARRLLRADVRL